MIPVAARSNTSFCSRSLAGILCSNPAGGTALRCQVPATSRSLVHSSPIECCVSVCHHKASMMKKSRPTGDVEPWGGVSKFLLTYGMKLINFSSEDLRIFMDPVLVGVSRITTWNWNTEFWKPCLMPSLVDRDREMTLSGSVLLLSSFYWASVANAAKVLQPYWLIVLPLNVPDLTASLLLWGPTDQKWKCLWTFLFSNVTTFASSRL